MARIDVAALTKSYGREEVLHEISITIADGEFVVLVGPSGCGKSTLLRSIAGIETITSGRISFDGRDVTSLPPQERNVAMVFQNYALYPHLTVAGNLAFGLKMMKLPRAEIATRVAETAALLSLTDLLNRRPRELSGGQRQRVAMGRAMVRRAKAFLFDEPLSNLDAQLRVQMRAEIRLLQQSLAATFLYVTHDQIEAMTMGERIAIMNKGSIEQIGTPSELYERPRNLFVAAFIGSPSMNFLPASASGGSARLANGVVVPLPVHASGEVTIGVRPEHIFLGRPSRDKIPLLLAVRMRAILGAQTEFRCDWNGIAVSVISQGSIGRDDASLEAWLDPRNILVFGSDGDLIG